MGSTACYRDSFIFLLPYFLMIATYRVPLFFIYVTVLLIQAMERRTNYAYIHYKAVVGLHHPETIWSELEKEDAKIWFDSYNFDFFLFPVQSSDSTVTGLRA
jgi:hypothetical protein